MTQSRGGEAENCVICREPYDYTGAPGATLRYYAQAEGPRGRYVAGEVRVKRRFGGPEIEDVDCLVAFQRLCEALRRNGWQEVNMRESPLRYEPNIHPAFPSAFRRAIK